MRCCDTCHPDIFSSLSPLQQPVPKARNKCKLKLEDYKMDSMDFKLKDGLKKWRTQQMEREFPGDHFFGPQLLLSDEILSWIVHLAHYRKLPDIQALHDQTDWQHAEKYRSAIIEMVKSCAPPPPPPPTPLPSSSSALQGVPNSLLQISQNTSSLPLKRSQHCAVCGAEGHIGMYWYS